MVDLNYLQEHFSSKRVLITGHSGFKGSWLTKILVDSGAIVAGLSLQSTYPRDLANLLNFGKNVNHYYGDIRDLDFVRYVFSEFKPEFVFHLAAQALVRASYDDPLTTFTTNIVGSANILDTIRFTPSVCSLVYITSDKCYENVEWLWGYRENDRLGGSDPYSASKSSAEIIFSSFHRSYFSNIQNLGVASARAGNVIGGGDWSSNRIIPDCIKSIESRSPIKLRNPYSTRPWQHVLEPLSGYLLLASKLSDNPVKWSGSWNFGPDSRDERNVLNVAESIIHYFGSGSIDIIDSSSLYHEANLLQLNCDKAHKMLSWSPRWSVDRTLEATALWYKKYLEGADMSSFTSFQISQYFT